MKFILLMKEFASFIFVSLITFQSLFSAIFYSTDTLENTDLVATDSTLIHKFIEYDSLGNIIPSHQDTLIETIADSTITRLDSIMMKPDTISLVLVGDVMLGTNYPSAQYLPPGNNCNALLDSVRQYLQDADLTFCNMEGVLAGDAGSPKSCKNPKTCYVFRMPDEYVNCYTEAGFDFVSVANNHVNDFGYQGRYHASKVLKEAGLHFAGFIEHPYTIFQIDSLRIGFCAFSTNSGVMDMRMRSEAEQIVRFLADTCDIVLISMHGGGEGYEFQHVTRKTETFLGADRGNVYYFAHRMIDAGADVIIGHGPHVTRAMEIYNNRYIAYSLGNFCTYSRFNLSGPNGIAPLVKIYIDREGKFIKGKVVPIKQIGEGGSLPDPEKRVIFKLQELNRTDFPDNQLQIDNEGNF